MPRIRKVTGSKSLKPRVRRRVSTKKSGSKYAKRSVPRKKGYGKRSGKPLYYGIGKLPKGYKYGDPYSAYRHKQIRYYGEKAIPLKLLNRIPTVSHILHY